MKLKNEENDLQQSELREKEMSVDDEEMAFRYSIKIIGFNHFGVMQ